MGGSAARYGDPRLPGRFWSKVRVCRDSGCWLWVAAKRRDDEGYGAFWMNGGHRCAHRVSYEALVGPIREGAQIDHLCRRRGCVNPAHLEPVTPLENTMRGEGPAAKNVRKSACPKGHPYDEGNTSRRSGKRSCRACHRERMSARAAERKSAGLCVQCDSPREPGRSRCEAHLANEALRERNRKRKGAA